MFRSFKIVVELTEVKRLKEDHINKEFKSILDNISNGIINEKDFLYIKDNKCPYQENKDDFTQIFSKKTGVKQCNDKALAKFSNIIKYKSNDSCIFSK